MTTDAFIRRPAISGIESVAFGVIGLAGLVTILCAASPIRDMGGEERPGVSITYRSNAVPSSPDMASSSTAQNVIYPRAI